MSIVRRTTSSGGVRYDARLRDPTGRAYSRTFRTKREAEAFESAQRTDRNRGTWFDVRAADDSPRWPKNGFTATRRNVQGRWLAMRPSSTSTSSLHWVTMPSAGSPRATCSVW